MILNELKHINKNLEEMKYNYEKFETRFEKFETRFEATKEKVDVMDGERGMSKWGIPIVVSTLIALIVSRAKGG